jgi:hypothetical protein
MKTKEEYNTAGVKITNLCRGIIQRPKSNEPIPLKQLSYKAGSFRDPWNAH